MEQVSNLTRKPTIIVNRRVALIAAFFYVALLTVVAIKVTQISIGPENKIVAPNLLFDDGGVYTAEAVALSNWAQLKDQPWFMLIQEAVTRTDLYVQWGYYGPRVSFIFSRGIRDGWLYIIYGFSQLTNSFQNALGFSILLFPVLVCVKYLFLWFYFVSSNVIASPALLVLFSTVLIDFGQPFGATHYWFVTSAYSLLFFSTALAIRFWCVDECRLNRSVSYLLLVLSVLMSQIALPIFIALALIDLTAAALPNLYQQATGFVNHHFLEITFIAIALTLPFALLWGGLQTALNPRAYNDVLRITQFRLEYLSIVNVGLLLLYSWLLQRIPEPKTHSAITGLIVAMILGAFTLVAAGTILDPETQHNSHRLNPFLFVALATAIVRMVFVQGQESLVVGFDRPLLLKALLGLGALIGIDKYRQPVVWEISRYQPFSDTDFPTFVTNTSGTQYFMANTPQQVYGYFIDEDFKKAPLVLNIRTERYSPEKAISVQASSHGENN